MDLGLRASAPARQDVFSLAPKEGVRAALPSPSRGRSARVTAVVRPLRLEDISNADHPLSLSARPSIVSARAPVTRDGYSGPLCPQEIQTPETSILKTFRQAQ